MINAIKKNIRANKMAYLAAAGFVSSVVTPLMFSQIPYVLALGWFGIFVLRNKRMSKAMLYLPLLLVLAISSIVNQVCNPRLFIFFALIVITSSIFSSRKIYREKCSLFRCILNVIFFVNILDIGCYFLGISYYYASGFAVFFSGLMPHPMWLAVVCGIANVVNVYFLLGKRNIREKILLGVIIALTLYLQFTAGSRSGILSTAIGGIFLLQAHFKSMVKVGIITGVVGVVITIAMPFLTRDSELLQSKMDQSVDNNSRTVLWNLRMAEIADSPLLGIGFARTFDPDDTGNINEGRAETGSGWLAVWSQTGIFALLIILGMVVSIFKKYGRAMLRDKELFIAVFAFLCVHSLFEGYLYTTFYLPCFLFWLLLNILYQAPVGKVKRVVVVKKHS